MDSTVSRGWPLDQERGETPGKMLEHRYLVLVISIRRLKTCNIFILMLVSNLLTEFMTALGREGVLEQARNP